MTPNDLKNLVKDQQLEAACILVERACRSIGPDTQVQFLTDIVSVAPLSWSGESSGDTLYEAIKDAQKR